MPPSARRWRSRTWAPSHAIQKALQYEIKRQVKAIEAGETIVQETRLWDEGKQLTKSMRSKEGASDYRYFPDPDLVRSRSAPISVRGWRCCRASRRQAASLRR